MREHLVYSDRMCRRWVWVLLVGFMTSAGASSARVTSRSKETAPVTYQERLFDGLDGELRDRVGRPEAMATLAALLRLEEDVPSRRIEAVLRRLAKDRRTDPLVAAQAAFHLARIERQSGQELAAHQRHLDLGLVREGWVVGPFDAQGRSGFDRVYPPEKEPQRPRRGEPWRAIPAGAVRDGALVLDGILRPDSDAAAYVLVHVRSDHARAAALRIGSPGPIKAWMNGAAVLARNVLRPAVLDQDAAPVWLRRGENWLLMKTVVANGAWRLYVRLTDPGGRPLSGLVVGAGGGATDVDSSLTPAGREGRPKEPRQLGELLRRRAEAARGAHAAGAWLDYARFLSFVQPQDGDSGAVEAALRRAGNGPNDAVTTEALLLLGELAREEDDRRSALEQVVRSTGDPGAKAVALTHLGESARHRRRDAAAHAYVQTALAADATCWRAVLALASEEQSAGLPSAALMRIESLPPTMGALPRVARARARLYEALGRKADAERIILSLYDRRRTDVELLQDLASAARNRGDLATAAERFRAAAVERPDLPHLEIERGRVLEARGDAAGAQATLAAAAERLPDEPRLHEEMGRLLVRAGKLRQARLSLARALELRPQNPALRRYFERLDREVAGGRRADAAADLAKAHAEDADALARAVLLGPTPPAVANDGAVVLLDRRVVRVHANGLSETFAQRVVHLRTVRATREHQRFSIRYTPGDQEVEIRKARILRRGGSDDAIEVSEATGRDDLDLSEPWYGLHYDFRAEVVSYDDLRAGDIIEVQYTLSDVGARNELADYFGDFQFIAETIAKRRWDYTLVGPTTRTFFFNDKHLDGVEKKVERRGTQTEYRFSARDVAKIDSEGAMPGLAEIAPYLHVSTYRSWEDVGRWYWHLVADQLAPDESVRKAAAAATAGQSTDEAKVRALHRFVIEGTRYVGLEFGIHGYKPYKVSQVLARRFGDCKDKASLLIALLREVGVDAELVLLRTRRGGRVDPSPASLAVFDHAIVYVPKLKLYLDGTAEFAGMTELPEQDQGVMVLRVGPGGSTLTDTPVLPATANRAARRWRVDIESEGRAHVAEELTISGQAAPPWRMHYQTPGERLERFGKVWTDRFPGARVESLNLEGLEDRNRPISLQARVDVPRIGELREERWMHLPVAARESELVRSYAPLSKRRWELVLSYPWQHDEIIEYHLPSGWEILRIPPGVSQTSAFGSFVLEIGAADDSRAVRVRSTLDVHRHRVPAVEYEAFRKFMAAVDTALAQRIVVQKKASE